MDHTHGAPLLVSEFPFVVPRLLVERLGGAAIPGAPGIRVRRQLPEKCPRLGEQGLFARFLALMVEGRPSRDPASEGGQATGGLEPLFQHGQPRERRIPAQIDLLNDSADFFGDGNAHAHGSKLPPERPVLQARKERVQLGQRGALGGF
ncbi:MAG: hypothetical protein ACKOLA_04320 [Spartobacteria bacterium]